MDIEVGPIRPPSEAGSLLLRVTRNCPWNRCRFCKLYKRQNFSIRPFEEIRADIDLIAQIREEISCWTSAGMPDRSTISEKLNNIPENAAQAYMHVLQWMAGGEESVFLQDANTMVLSLNKLQEILIYLREKLPQVKRVTSYGRVDSLAKFSSEQFTLLKKAGLDRIHSGYESGSDKVLELINKGYTKAQEIEVGRRIKSSGIELSVYFMPGVGGRDLSDENAIETADVINNINPDFVRIRTFVSLPGTGLMDDINAGIITECTDKEKALELKKMIMNISGVDGHLYSDHIINLFEDVNGDMQADKEKMLAVFEAFEQMDTRGQRRYQITRRLGMVRSMRQMDHLEAKHQDIVNHYFSLLDTAGEFEAFLIGLLRRYI